MKYTVSLQFQTYSNVSVIAVWLHFTCVDESLVILEEHLVADQTNDMITAAFDIWTSSTH